jgi:hypothetical protein
MENSTSKQAPGQNKTITIVVNGRPTEFRGHKISYAEVVNIAFPGMPATETMDYTVTYSWSHGKSGTLVGGQDTPVKGDTVFNVTRTNRG